MIPSQQSPLEYMVCCKFCAPSNETQPCEPLPSAKQCRRWEFMS